jgi:DNA-binding transcriptional MerR regulator
VKPYGSTRFALKVGCSTETARELDKRGIVKAERTEHGWRRYDDRDVEKARAYLGSVGRLRTVT